MAAYWLTTAEQIKHRQGNSFLDYVKYCEKEFGIPDTEDRIREYSFHFNINYDELIAELIKRKKGKR